MLTSGSLECASIWRCVVKIFVDQHMCVCACVLFSSFIRFTCIWIKPFFRIERLICYDGRFCWRIMFDRCEHPIEHGIKHQQQPERRTEPIDRMIVCYMAKLVFTWQMFNLCDWRWLCAHRKKNTYSAFDFVNAIEWCTIVQVSPIQSDSKNTIIFDFVKFLFSPLLFEVKKTLGISKRVTPKYFISNFHFKAFYVFFFSSSFFEPNTSNRQ